MELIRCMHAVLEWKRKERTALRDRTDVVCICINIMSMWRSCGKLYIVRIAVVVYNRVAQPCDDGTCRVSHVFSHRLKSISTACIRTYKTMNLCFSHLLLTSISI